MGLRCRHRNILSLGFLGEARGHSLRPAPQDAKSANAKLNDMDSDSSFLD